MNVVDSAPAQIIPPVQLRFRQRERNWWTATDRTGRWDINRHGDGYLHLGWCGIVDGRPEQFTSGGYHRRADAVALIEQQRPNIQQLVRDRRAHKDAARST